MGQLDSDQSNNKTLKASVLDLLNKTNIYFYLIKNLIF